MKEFLNSLKGGNTTNIMSISFLLVFTFILQTIEYRLTLNLTKSHFLIFSRRRFLQNNIAPIRINNQTINKLNQTEFLGFILQDNLKWDSHISRLVNKINKFNSILFLTRQHFDIRTLTLLYNSLIYSNLAYGTVILGKTSNKNIQNLFISQKKDYSYN